MDKGCAGARCGTGALPARALSAAGRYAQAMMQDNGRPVVIHILLLFQRVLVMEKCQEERQLLARISGRMLFFGNATKKMFLETSPGQINNRGSHAGSGLSR